MRGRAGPTGDTSPGREEAIIMDARMTLDTPAAQQALESAIRTQAQVVLESSAIPNTTINGALISGDERALLMEITGRPARDPAGLINAAAQVQVFSDRRYCFATTITAAPRWGDTRALAFDRPEVITVLDRRRFVRARLAPSSRVNLEWKHAGVDNRRLATMLNISPEGIACRLDDAKEPPIPIGGSLRVRFTLPGQGSAFHLSATVSNATPASDGSTILGLHFDDTTDARSQFERLKEALRAPRDAEVESEVFA